MKSEVLWIIDRKLLLLEEGEKEPFAPANTKIKYKFKNVVSK